MTSRVQEKSAFDTRGSTPQKEERTQVATIMFEAADQEVERVLRKDGDEVTSYSSLESFAYWRICLAASQSLSYL